uniref:Uncharacterized protein n=1 Tax=Anguilla anguilla TaxID=7936 RepID=A0A0E9U7F3_ANGAN
MEEQNSKDEFWHLTVIFRLILTDVD